MEINPYESPNITDSNRARGTPEASLALGAYQARLRFNPFGHLESSEMGEYSILQRFVFGLVGFFLGALIVLFALLGFSDFILWWAVVLGGIVCAIPAAVIGESFIDWLKDLWWWH